MDPEIDGLSQEEIKEFTNALKIFKMDKTSNQERIREDPTRLYVPTLVKTALGVAGQASIIRAPTDLGNLLVHAAINAEFHVKLGIPIKIQKSKP